MKTILSSLFLFFLLPLPLLAEAGKEKAVDFTSLKHPLKPALFQIEGKGLTKPSYLFGTIHLGDPRVTTLHPDAEKAFVAADRFFAEIDLDPAGQVALTPMLMRKDGQSLRESIGPDLSKDLESALKAINPQLNSKMFDPLKTWVVTMQLPLLELQLKGQKALDAVLYERAGMMEKKVAGLETAESQLKIFDELKEKTQIAFLKSTLEFMAQERKAGKNSTKKLVDLYLGGELEKMGDLVKTMMEDSNELDDEMKEISDRFMKKILADRNISMTKTIGETLTTFPDESHFFAIGAAHFTDKTAIQDLLAKKGYTLTPLFD